MIKTALLSLLLAFPLLSVSGDTRDREESELYQDRMKQLITEIRHQAEGKKLIITQNGNALYFRHGEIDTRFLPITDGTTQESLYFGGVLQFDRATDEKDKNELLALLAPIRQTGKPVLLINYGQGADKKAYLTEEDMRSGFVSELLPAFEATALYEPIHPFTSDDITALTQVKNFLMLLNPEKAKNRDAYFQRLANTDFDLLLIEPAHEGEFLTKEQIARLKNKKNGGRRLVIAYFSVGEAENYRAYWQAAWHEHPPSWIVAENPDWPGNYLVKYWQQPWKDILYAYQKNLDALGVDGYLLDTVDSYEYFQDNGEK